MCTDGSCSASCTSSAACINNVTNNICEPGEGCACQDCDGKKDSCASGLVCSFYTKKCISPPSGCGNGETLCNDLSCDDTCSAGGGKRGCIGAPDNICSQGEGCACSDCDGYKDSCATGYVCNYQTKLCQRPENRSSGGGAEKTDNCIDFDNDGYYKNTSTCHEGNDCNDNSPDIRPGALETCNNIDDDCNNLVDDNCFGGQNTYGIEINVQSQERPRVFERFKLRASIKNNLNKPVTGLVLTLDAPGGFYLRQGSYSLSLSPMETKEILIDILIKDYRSEQATLNLNAMLPDSSIMTKQIPLSIDIPSFLVTPDPDDLEEGRNCINFYYVINRDISGIADVEFDVLDPASIFGKSVIVDYISSISPDGNIIIEPMISNPYCLPPGKQYEVRGYLYQSNGFKFVNAVDESVELIELT